MNKKILKDVLYGVIVVVLLAIQSSNILMIWKVMPDFLLLIVILHSIAFGDFKGEMFGFSVGLLVDSMSGTLFGINAFVYTFIAWFTTVYKKFIQVSDVASFIFYIVIATVIKYIFYALFHWIFQRMGFFDVNFFLKLLGEIAYNVVFGIIFYFATPALYKRDEALF